jgi:hypothetical protein
VAELKRVMTVNVQSYFGTFGEYPKNINSLRGVLRNIRYKARSYGYDLADWDDANILLLEDFIDDEVEAREVLDAL